MSNKRKTQSYILGIDTGGTFTDSVLLNADTKEVVCYSKALTTKEDLRVGIKNSIDRLDSTGFADIRFVSLSTTLATNAIVEGKGCKTGLILMGKEIQEELPTQKCYFICGKVDIHGNVLESMNQEEIIQAAANLKNEVETIAVSCYASVRNPRLELSVKKIIEAETGKPVFCAHELTGSLGFYERTVTSVLNASLVKMIDDFILSTKAVLEAKQITAPIMVVKGDGSLMHETVARQKPIETILSGPAASTIGASHLTRVRDAFIIDIGGTTSDIINITDGTAGIRSEGASVGGWLTRVKAANVCTYGLGGDSLIALDYSQGTIQIGPEKVEPLCVTAVKCASAKQELSSIEKSQNTEPICLYRKGKQTFDMMLSEQEKHVLKVLGHNAFTVNTITKLLQEGGFYKTLDLSGLVKSGALIKCSITPTDILHALGRYSAFDPAASEMGLALTAASGGLSLSDFIAAASKQITKQLYLFCLQSAAAFEEHDFDFQEDDASMYLLDKAFNMEPDEFLKAEFTLNKPIVGVGAPAHAWLPEVAKKLNAPLIIPKYAEVTSALGATLGQVMEAAQAVIRPSCKKDEFILYMPKEKLIFNNKEKALQYAKKQLCRQIEENAKSSGGKNIEITTSVKPVYTQSYHSKEKTYIETRIDAFAVAVPKVLG